MQQFKNFVFGRFYCKGVIIHQKERRNQDSFSAEMFTRKIDSFTETGVSLFWKTRVEKHKEWKPFSYFRKLPTSGNLKAVFLFWKTRVEVVFVFWKTRVEVVFLFWKTRVEVVFGKQELR